MAAADTNANSYRNILKGTSLLGGVQIFQILMNLVRGKFVALFLGPEGMGIASMLTSSTNTLVRFSSLGLNLSIVREAASAGEDTERLGSVARVAMALVRITGFIGALTALALAPWLSEWSFGSAEYAWQFRALSVFVYLMVVSGGSMALIQGLHKVRLLSLTSLAGAAVGLAGGVPMYWLWGDKGIVPAMILSALTLAIGYAWGLRRVVPSCMGFSLPERSVWMPLLKRLVSAGVVLLAASLIGTAMTWLVDVYVRISGDLADVGLFNAANSLGMQYAGVVFAAMALDYLPRLSAAGDDNRLMSVVIDRQLEIVSLIVAPLCLLLIATAPWVMRLLLTPEFLPAVPLLRWLGISILLKALCYPLGYVAFARDRRKLFFWLEGVGFNILYLGCAVAGYRLSGLVGLGYGAVVEQGICLITYFIVCRKAFGYLPDPGALRQMIVAVCFAAAAFAITLLPEGWVMWVASGVLILVCGFRSLTVLRYKLKK